MLDLPQEIQEKPDARSLETVRGEIAFEPSLEVIDGAGPEVYLDKSQTFNQVLENFLGEH